MGHPRIIEQIESFETTQAIKLTPPGPRPPANRATSLLEYCDET